MNESEAIKHRATSLWQCMGADMSADELYKANSARTARMLVNRWIKIGVKLGMLERVTVGRKARYLRTALAPEKSAVEPVKAVTHRPLRAVPWASAPLAIRRGGYIPGTGGYGRDIGA